MERRAAIAVSIAAWTLGMPLAHGVVPWAIAGLLAWVALTGFASLAEMPAQVALDWQPKLFLARRPYAHTRNPMYVGELSLWLGWAIWLGSPLVALAGCVLFAEMQRTIRREERDLATRFGDAYRAYCAAVPRWLAQ